MLRRLQRTFQVLSDPTRLRILKVLQQGERCVQDIAQVLRVKPSCASRHLSELERVGFVTHRRQGPWAFHRLDTGGSNRYVRPLLDLLSGWLVHDEQIQMDRKRSEALGQ